MKNLLFKIKKNIVFLSAIFIFAFYGFGAFSASKKNSNASVPSNSSSGENAFDLSSGSSNPFKARTVENVVGNVKILAKGSVGSFQLYSLGSNGSQTALLASYDEFTSSFLSLLTGKKEYKLTDNTGISIGARQTERGIQLFYSIPNVAWVLYSIESVNQDRNLITSDIIKISVSVLNKGKRTQNFAVKTVYDTVLGEQLGPHFSTNEEIAINNERQFRRFDKTKWIKSSNSRAGIEFLLNGADITTPEVVSLSNKDLLALQKWIPQTVSSRTFDSVLSYNNSAICINFPSCSLDSGEQFTNSFYIAVSNDGKALDGEKYIDYFEGRLSKDSAPVSSESDRAYLRASELYIAGKYPESYEIVQKEWKNEYNRTERLSSLKKMLEQKLGLSSDAPYSYSDVQQTVQIPKNIDDSYVQELLQKIQALRDDGEDVNRDELIRLGAELDAVTRQLERQ